MSIKQLFAIIIIFFAVTDFCLAEDKIVNTQSKIGATIGMYIPRAVGFGGNIFSNHILSNNWFLSVNCGVTYYSIPFTNAAEYQIDIPLTLGINVFLYKDLSLGLEIGCLQQTFSSPYENNLGLIFIPVIGVSSSITKNICLTGNIKLQFGMLEDWDEKYYLGLYNFGINFGVAYFFNK